MRGCIRGLQATQAPGRRLCMRLNATNSQVSGTAVVTPVEGSKVLSPGPEEVAGTRIDVRPGRMSTSLFDKPQQGPKLQQGDRVMRVAALPAEKDAELFTLDPSVQTWCNPERPYSEQRGDLTDILQLVAAQASKDAQSSAYWAYHMARFSFFVTQAATGLFAHTISERFAPKSGQPAVQDTSQLPLARISKNASTELANRLWEAYGAWKQDLAWIAAGMYKMPWDMVTPNRQFNPLVMGARTVRFALEGADTLQRNLRGKPDTLWLQAKQVYPQYYNTFHNQTDGWLSSWSASNYEHSTEVLFLGRQDAMQRSALVPITQYVAASAKPAAEMKLLEVAAGTGRFHTFIKDNWPEMRSLCSDLSPFYLERARANMKEWKRLRQPNKWLGGVDDTGVEYMQMPTEKLDLPDASCDIVVCVYLFHELPETIRRKAVAEWFRVLKPGGLCVLTDSTQLGDRPEFGASMARFGSFNEPYFENYISCDLGGLLVEAGFEPGTKYITSATKTLSATKPL